MNRDALIAAISEKTGLPKTKVKVCVKAMEETVSDELENGGKVSLKGFGTFTLSSRNGRNYKDINTGEIKTSNAVTSVKFTVGSLLKERVNNAI